MYENNNFQNNNYPNNNYPNNNYPNNNYPNNSYQSPYHTYESSMMNNSAAPKPPEKPKKKNHSGLKKVAGLTLSGILFGFFAGLVMVIVLQITSVQNVEDNSVDNLTNTAVISDELTLSGNEIVNEQQVKTTTVVTDVTTVVEKVMPSVVSITGMYKVEDEYFGYMQGEEATGSGSGIIVGKNDTELLIVTNNHVVDESTSLSVQFIDETTCDASVKGTDANEDLAVIAVKLEDISADSLSKIQIATLGDSDSLKVGEPAIAIGNALGYGQSVTTGVISALNREYTQEDYTTYLIQTDAAINPGNSGGALLNVAGEVIGINSNKIASDTVEGMGYAIPISTAKPIIEDLMSKETKIKADEDKKAYLGVSGVNVTTDVQETYGMPEGVYIAQVYDGSAAQKAGLAKGDILISFDGEKITTFEDLSNMMQYYASGDTVTIVYMQGSADGYVQKEVSITLGGLTQ